MQILAVIGHILLIILYIVIALVICLVVLPVVYRVRVIKPEEGPYDARGVVRWLFGFVWFSFVYGPDGFERHLRVAGIPISDILKRRKEKKAPKVYEGPLRAKKQPTIKPGQRTYTEEEKKAAEAEVHYIDEENRRYFKDESVFEEPAKKNIFEKIGLTIKGIYDKLKSLSKDAKALIAAWPYIFKLIKHVRPRRIKGEVEFGFDDPSITGNALGFIGMLYPVIPEEMEIIPNFQEKKMICDLNVGGHLFIVYVVIYVIKILRLPEFKAFMKRRKMRRARKNVG